MYVRWSGHSGATRGPWEPFSHGGARPQGLTGYPRPSTPYLPRHVRGVGCGLDPHDPEWPSAQAQTCSQLLTLVSSECNVPKEPFVLSCQADMATCAQPGQQNCSCATLSEYSRQCSMAGQPVNSWRGPGLCCESQGGWQGGTGPQIPTPRIPSCPQEGRRHGRGRGGWQGSSGTPASLTWAAVACSCGPVPSQPGVPGVRRGLCQDLLQPAAQLLQLLHLWLLLPRR